MAEERSPRDRDVRAGRRVVDDAVVVEIHRHGGGIFVLIDNMRREERNVGLLDEERIHVDQLNGRQGTAGREIHHHINVEETVGGKVVLHAAAFDLAGAHGPGRGLHPGLDRKSHARG